MTKSQNSTRDGLSKRKLTNGIQASVKLITDFYE